MRQIVGLESAQPCAAVAMPKSKTLSAVQRSGLRYERAVWRELSGLYSAAEHNPWFSYADTNGSGVCSPDILLHMLNYTVVVECKLSLVSDAYAQLRHLYLPVVARALRRPTYGLIITKVLRPGAADIAPTLRDAIRLSLAGKVPILHWLGRGPIERKDIPSGRIRPVASDTQYAVAE